jgi:hypothetical protein
VETAPANLGGGDTAADRWIKKGTVGATALDAEATAMADGQRSVHTCIFCSSVACRLQCRILNESRGAGKNTATTSFD